MQQTNLGKAYSELPTWAKGILWVGGGIAVVALALTVKNLLKKNQGKTDAKTWQRDEEKLIDAGQRPSFSDSQMTGFANQIYESVRYGVGDDYGKVVDILKQMKNDLDVARMVRFYGSRQRYNFGIPVGEPSDLFTTLTAELGNEYMGLTSYRLTQINEDWSKKGITYRV